MEIFNQEGSDFAYLRKFCDGRVRTVDGHDFRVHRSFVASKSVFFKEAFEGDADGQLTEEVFVTNVRGEIVEQVLTFIYTGNISIQADNIRSFISAACYLKMDRLARLCLAVLDNMTSVENCVELLEAASRLPQIERNASEVFEDLYRKCFRYVQTHFTVAMSYLGDSVLKMPLDTFRDLLESDLNLDDERVAWSAIVSWANSDPDRTFALIPELLFRIRLEDATLELVQEILAHPCVSENAHFDPLRRLMAAGVTSEADAKDCLVRAVKLLAPGLRLDARHPATRFCRVLSDYDDDLGTTICISYDDVLYGVGSLWYDIAEIDAPRHPRLLPLADSLLMFDRGARRAGWTFWMDLGGQNDLELLPPLVERRRTDHCVATVGDCAYFIGGHFVDRFTVERWRLGDDQWSTDVSQLPFNLMRPLAVTCGDRIYTIGEAADAGALLNDVSGDGADLVRFHEDELTAAQVYDPLEDVWSPFPAPHMDFVDLLSMAALEDSFFAFGDNGHMVERYHVRQGQWTIIQNVPGEFVFPISTMLGGNLIVYDKVSELSEPSCFRWVQETDEWEPFQIFDPAGKSAVDIFEIRDPRANRKVRSFLKNF